MIITQEPFERVALFNLYEMYDFSKVKIAFPLTAEWILKQIDDSLIFTYYFGRFSIGKAYRSFFDKKDTNPSTTFFISKSGKIIYFDFRTEERLNCFTFVQKMFPGMTFKEALEKVASDFGLIDKTTNIVPQKIIEDAAEIDKSVKKDTLIQIEKDEWNQRNLAYWRLFEITAEELIQEDIYPVKRLFLNHIEIHNPGNYERYAYIEEFDGKVGVKIYSPRDPHMKWLSSIPLDVPFGLNSLCYRSDRIIVTKSQKDRLVLQKLFYDVIALQNESEGAMNKYVRDLLYRRYLRKLMIFDNDEVGVENCKKYNAKGFDYFNVPKKEYLQHKIKDPSDYVRQYGIDALEDLFIQKGIIPDFKIK